MADDDSKENTDDASEEQQNDDSNENTDAGTDDQQDVDSNEGDLEQAAEERVVRKVASKTQQSADNDNSAEDVESNEVSTKSYPVDDLLMVRA